MKVLREVTEWSDATPNHDYVVNDAGKCVAYRRVDTAEWFIFRTPIMFSRSRRKFKTLKENFSL